MMTSYSHRFPLSTFCPVFHNRPSIYRGLSVRYLKPEMESLLPFGDFSKLVVVLYLSKHKNFLVEPRSRFLLNLSCLHRWSFIQIFECVIRSVFNFHGIWFHCHYLYLSSYTRVFNRFLILVVLNHYLYYSPYYFLHSSYCWSKDRLSNNLLPFVVG